MECLRWRTAVLIRPLLRRSRDRWGSIGNQMIVCQSLLATVWQWKGNCSFETRMVCRWGTMMILPMTLFSDSLISFWFYLQYYGKVKDPKSLGLRCSLRGLQSQQHHWGCLWNEPNCRSSLRRSAALCCNRTWRLRQVWNRWRMELHARGRSASKLAEDDLGRHLPIRLMACLSFRGRRWAYSDW